MKKRIQTLTFVEHTNCDTLTQAQNQLLTQAKGALTGSYSPYSHFKVSAAILLENQEVITGTNQENIAYPSGMCAERVALFYAMAKYPNVEIKKIALTAQAENFTVENPISPCGACRQALIEYRLNQKKPIELIMQGEKGNVIVIDDLKELMPLHFCETNLRD